MKNLDILNFTSMMSLNFLIFGKKMNAIQLSFISKYILGPFRLPTSNLLARKVARVLNFLLGEKLIQRGWSLAV